MCGVKRAHPPAFRAANRRAASSTDVSLGSSSWAIWLKWPATEEVSAGQGEGWDKLEASQPASRGCPALRRTLHCSNARPNAKPRCLCRRSLLPSAQKCCGQASGGQADV